MEQLQSKLLDERDIDPVAAIDAPAASLCGVRLVEHQLGPRVRTAKIWFLGRELATRDHFDLVVLALFSELGTQRTTSAQSESRGTSGSVLAKRG